MSDSAASQNRYDQRNVHTMESVYGRGYLSPGGDEEVSSIVSGLQIEDSTILDIGCGLGGPAIALAKLHGAQHVTAIDIEQSVLDRAQDLVQKENLSDRINVQLVEPRYLPFPDQTFDFVYMNSVSCHIRDLVSFFDESYRVLKPGACLVGSEWFKGDDAKAYKQWDDLLRDRGLNFYFVDQSDFRLTLEHCGFVETDITDRSSTISELARNIMQSVSGSLQPELRQTLGDEGYQSFLEWARARAVGLENKGSYHCHFRARKSLAADPAEA